MSLRSLAFVACLAFLFGSSTYAQSQGQPARPGVAAGEADPGVRPTRIIDRAEVRLSRVELQPGAVRSVHAHTDAEYHLWVPISGSLEITIGTDKPVAAAHGQAFFMKKGTSHGFRNTGTTTAAVFEIFIKQTTASASMPLSPSSPLPTTLAEVLALLEN